MTISRDNLTITAATVNGSGSQSANQILLRSLFRMKLGVSGKNLFPSNIAGLPTWFHIRINSKNFTSLEELSDIIVCLNKQTVVKDLKRLKPHGVALIQKGYLKEDIELEANQKYIEVDFMAAAGTVNKSIQLKKLIVNMVYVGYLAEALEIDQKTLSDTVTHQFHLKPKVVEVNQQAVAAGRALYREQPELTITDKFTPVLSEKEILVDGNRAAALGHVYGGCTFVSWYPITPSSSLAEDFESFARKYRTTEDGTQNFAILQAEDELSAISMVTGASWAGARAMTATSGPGISLMSECAGLMYFAEIPGVIWNIQRAGPSTGLPTRTLQGDLLSAAMLSHGDAKHPVLLPGTPRECFEMSKTAMDLSEELQTLVFALSDLDLGMNLWTSQPLEMSKEPIKRGKVLSKVQLDKLEKFERYADTDGDGIPHRTLPGTPSDLAAYFTRGTGHNTDATYTEDSDTFKALLDRLNKKWSTIKTMVPKPVTQKTEGAKIGFIAYGSTDLAMDELRELCKESGYVTNYMRLRAYPFNQEVYEFINQHDEVYMIEQNRDAQMKSLMMMEKPEAGQKLRPILSYDGLPVRASHLYQQFLNAKNSGGSQ